MSEQTSGHVPTEPNARLVLRTVLDTPYIEHSALAEATGLTAAELDDVLEDLVARTILLELASQADSSVESRVPKRVYMVNPEMEDVVRRAS